MALPKTQSELEELLADDTRREEIFGDPEKTTEFLASYARAMNSGEALSKQIAEQTAEQSAALVTDWLKEQGVADRPDFSNMAADVAKQITNETRNRENPVHNPKALGAKLDGMFESPAEFFQAIWHQQEANGDLAATRNTLRNAFSEGVPSEGGFLVPEEFRAELLRVALESSVVRPRARVIPMNSQSIKFPAVDSTSNASSVYGGIITYWTEEAGTITASNAKFGSIELEARKLTAYALASNELVSDSAISFDAFIGTAFPEALAFEEDYQFLQGNGAGVPQGVLNSPAIISITKETGQAANTIVWENIIKAYARMLPSSLGRAVWLAAPDTFPELATMALSVGTGGSAIWLNNGVVGPPMTILGRPVVFTEKVNTLGSAGDIVFADLGFYLIGDRQAMSARSSEHVAFAADQTAFRLISRVDGRPWIQSAITPKNSGDTLSPFVQIAVRA